MLAYRSPWYRAGGQWELRGAETPFRAEGFYTPEKIAQTYRETVGAGTMSEAEFLAFARSHGIPDQSIIAARNILIGGQATVYSIEQRVAALRATMQADPSVTFDAIVRAGAAYGLSEPEVREAYAVLMREQSPPPPPPPPAVTVQIPAIANEVPIDWLERNRATVLPPVTPSGAVSFTASPGFRDIEAGGGGLFPSQPAIPPVEQFGVDRMPETPSAISPALLAAGAAVAVFLLVRRK